MQVPGHGAARPWPAQRTLGSTTPGRAPAQTKPGSLHPSSTATKSLRRAHTARLSRSSEPAHYPAHNPLSAGSRAGSAHQVQHSEQGVAIPARALAPQLSVPPPERRHRRGACGAVTGRAARPRGCTSRGSGRLPAPPREPGLSLCSSQAPQTAPPAPPRHPKLLLPGTPGGSPRV